MNELDNSWHPEKMLEVQLKEPDDFLKVRETLTRIGVASRKDKKLFQSCHILHKQGRYFIVHFKELFALDGKEANLTENDIERRNTIAFFFITLDRNLRLSAIFVFLLFGSNSISSLMILNTCERPFFGGMYNSMASENKMRPILSLFCVAEKASVAAISVTISFLN